MSSTNFNELFIHPVLSNYIEYKYEKFKSWNQFNFWMYFIAVAYLVICHLGDIFHFLILTSLIFLMRVIFRIVFALHLQTYELSYKNKNESSSNQLVFGWSLIEAIWKILQTNNKNTISLIFETVLIVLSLFSLNKICFSLSIILIMIDLTLCRAIVFPLIGNYALMLEKVSMITFKVILIFSWIIFLFAIIFNIMFKIDGKEANFNNFESIWTSVVKSTRMVTGETEASGLNFDENWNYFLFLYFMLPAISISYLINALAIVDIKVTLRQI